MAIYQIQEENALVFNDDATWWVSGKAGRRTWVSWANH